MYRLIIIGILSGMILVYCSIFVYSKMNPHQIIQDNNINKSKTAESKAIESTKEEYKKNNSPTVKQPVNNSSSITKKVSEEEGISQTYNKPQNMKSTPAKITDSSANRPTTQDDEKTIIIHHNTPSSFGSFNTGGIPPMTEYEYLKKIHDTP